MKAIKVKEFKTTVITKYEAVDGTIFDYKDDCERWEKSAKSLLFSHYNKLIQKKVSESELFCSMTGNETYMIDVVKVTSEEQKDIIKQIYLMYHPTLAACININDTEHVNKYEYDAYKAIDSLGTSKSNNIIFIGRGNTDCEHETEWFEVLYTYKQLIDSISNSTIKESEEE